MMLVMKFGGTSVGSVQSIQRVIEIVEREHRRGEGVVVVTSAMSGVTNALVRLVNSAIDDDQRAVQDQIDALRQRHLDTIQAFLSSPEALIVQIDTLLEELAATCQQISDARSANGRLRDATMSMGERLMARVLAAILSDIEVKAQVIDAIDLIVTDDRHQNAQPLHNPSQVRVSQILLPILQSNVVPVVTGFIGATTDGVITTLGRGGSDYSATYLASLIGAKEVWIWTDVNGVMSADPRKIKEAEVMDSISYEAVSEFAHFGAKVLHPRAVEPLMSPHIPLRVCNTFNPEHPGTRINSEHPDGPKYLNAVTSIQGVLVFVPDTGTMLELAEKVLREQLLHEARPAITVNSHAGRLLCYVVPTTASRTAMQDSVKALQAELQENYPDAGWRVEPITIVAAIGVVEIQQTVQVLNAVKSVRADLLAMGHGSPQCCLLAVRPKDGLRVMQRLHRMAINIRQKLDYAENDPMLVRGRKRRQRPQQLF